MSETFDLAFHWDPMCPFAWLTSLWMDQVIEQRGLNVGTLLEALPYIRQFRERGARMTLLPCTTAAEDVIARDPDLVFLANGPGDPAALDYVVDTVRTVIGRRPVVGICLGHQLLCRAVGLRHRRCVAFGFHQQGAAEQRADRRPGEVRRRFRRRQRAVGQGHERPYCGCGSGALGEMLLR